MSLFQTSKKKYAHAGSFDRLWYGFEVAELEGSYCILKYTEATLVCKEQFLKET